MSFGYTTSSAESVPAYGPTAMERRRAYEARHRDRYFRAPDRSQSREWECWEQRTEADDMLIRKHTGLAHLMGWLEDQDRNPALQFPEVSP